VDRAGCWNLPFVSLSSHCLCLTAGESRAEAETTPRIDVTNPNDLRSFALNDHIPVLAVFE